MRRISGLVGPALLCAALVPSGVDANHNCSKVSILSRRFVAAQVKAVNPHELVICPPGQGLDHVVDGRIILPGADQVSIRYESTPPPNQGSPPITATLSGLGISGQYQLTPKLVLEDPPDPVPSPARVWTYASSWIGLPPGAQGQLVATVGADSATYRTVP